MNFKKIALPILAMTLIAGIATAGMGKNPSGVSRPESVVAPGSNKRLGPEVPFPLSASLPFPWKKIEGLWEAVGPNGQSVLFSFERRYDYEGNDILQVTQLAGSKIIAEGLGIQGSEDNLVRAAMYGFKSDASYMLFVGSYKNPKSSKSKPITVVTVRAFGEMSGAGDVQLVIKKLK